MKTNKLLSISISAGIALGISVGCINASAQQKELASIEHNPQVYEIGTHADCDLQYIRTSHKENAVFPETIYKEDIYLKSVCEDSSSVSKVKGNISFNRMKLLSDNEVLLKKPKM